MKQAAHAGGGRTGRGALLRMGGVPRIWGGQGVQGRLRLVEVGSRGREGPRVGHRGGRRRVGPWVGHHLGGRPVGHRLPAPVVVRGQGAHHLRECQVRGVQVRGVGGCGVEWSRGAVIGGAWGAR